MYSPDTMSPAAPPPEIVDQILDFLPDTPDGRKALKSASLICSSFLPSARARLFSHISLRDSDSEPTTLQILLQRAPHLVSYIEVLRIVGDVYTQDGAKLFVTSTTLPASLKALQSGGSHSVALRRIVLYGIDWKNMSSGMQAVLIDLLACSSLHHVRLKGVSRYPANLIDHLPPAVKSLHISNTNILFSKVFRRLLQLEALTIRLPVTKHSQCITGKVLQFKAGWVAQLRSLELSTCDATLWPIYRAIVQNSSSSLEELYILINIIAEQFEPVDLGRFPRLRKIVIITPHLHSWLLTCLASFRAAIIWLARSLSNMPHNNSINHLTIRFYIAFTHGHVWDDHRFNTGIERATWENLDEILSQPSLASSTTFRGLNLQICADTKGIYEYLNRLAHAKLPRAGSLKRLHVTQEKFNDIRYNVEFR